MSKAKYHPVNADRDFKEDEETLLEESSSIASHYDNTKGRPRIFNWPLGLLFVGICFAMAFTGALLARWWSQPSNVLCTEMISHKSPVLKEVAISYHTVRFNGSLFKENIYRQTGSPDVDAAWEALGVNYRDMAIPADEARIAGIASDQVQMREKYGGGYLANLEGLHYLHCLNMLRKGLWFNYQYYHDLGENEFANEDFVIRSHVTHCLDVLRQQLMCTVDIGLLGQVWWKNETIEQPKPFPDFHTDHVCRNYDDIRRWAEVRQLPKPHPEDYLEMPAEGAHLLPEIP